MIHPVDVAWHDRIAVVDSTGCWIHIPAYPTWTEARAHIAALFNVPDSNCALTACCVSPMHGPDTRRPAGGAA